MKIPLQLRQSELVLWFLLQDTSKRFFASVEAEMNTFGMTRAQWYLLTHVYYYEGLTQQELADGMDLTKSGAAKVIRRLEEKRWIRRKADDKDGRLQRVYLVEDVKPIVGTLANLATALLEIPLSRLSREEISQLTRLLRKVEAGLDQSPSSSAQLELARTRMRKALAGSHLESAARQRVDSDANLAGTKVK